MPGSTPLLLNADLSRRAVVAPPRYEWLASPQAGVDRVMLDRVGAEQARATSLVRYAPGSSFPPHAHPGGEEILVLSGTFSDEDGHYPEGWYLRNPPGSGHRPFSTEGALIFVKLRQMAADETRRVRIDTRNPSAWLFQEDREVCPLYAGAAERVCLQRLPAGTALPVSGAGGAELLVLAGDIAADAHAYGRGSWIRLPPEDRPGWRAGPRGATVYLKTGHLAVEA